MRNQLTKSPECWIDAVGSVGGSHDDDVGSLFQTVHQSQQLGDNAPLNLSVGLNTQKTLAFKVLGGFQSFTGSSDMAAAIND